MLKTILLSAVIVINIIAALHYGGAYERELYKPLRINHFITALLCSLTAISIFIATLVN
jgi:hypothetical protein